MTNHLEALAKCLEGDPFFLASSLKLYALSEDLDDNGLMQALECTTETLTLLRLCRTPDPSRFKADIEQIVTRFQVNRTALLQAVRRGQSIVHLQRTSADGRDMLIAARDGDQETTPEKARGGGP
jgi:hypothetical protein